MQQQRHHSRPAANATGCLRFPIQGGPVDRSLQRYFFVAAAAALLCAGALAQAQTPAKRDHNVILRVVRVPPEWSPFVYEGGGWASAVMVRESESLKYFEAAIWLEERAIHLYEFDNHFQPHLWDMTPEEWTAHRESYLVMRFAGLPLPPPDDHSSSEISSFIREAFRGFADYIVSQYPDSEHHLIFAGHGAPGGRLFEYQLFYEDASELLAHWTRALGRPLGVIDMGGPCTKGGYEDLTNFCQYARFYIASDMPNGGFGIDDWTFEKFQETNVELQYHRLFAEASDLRAALVGRVNLRQKDYEYGRKDLIKDRWMQATYLYSCQEFVSFSRQFLAFLRRKGAFSYDREDVLEFLRSHGAGPELEEAFERVIAHRVDNRDFFEWPESRNGLLMPASSWPFQLPVVTPGRF